MPFAANVVSVLIASTGDVASERDALRKALWDFNDEHAAALEVILLPVLWETHSRADLGTAPQELLDEQIVDSADMVIGVFWTRIGTLLPDGTAATVHELERIVSAGKPALLCFSNQPAAPSTIDGDQLAAVGQFKARAREWGIYREYDSVAGLVEQVRRDLLKTVRDRLQLPTPESPRPAAGTGARVVARPRTDRVQKFSSNGRPRVETHYYLVLDNVGGVTADHVEYEWLAPEPLPDEWAPPGMIDSAPIEHLAPGGPVEIPIVLTWGGYFSLVLRLRWRQPDGTEEESRQTVRFT